MPQFEAPGCDPAAAMRMAAADADRPAGSLAWARAMDELAESYLEGPASVAGLDAAVEVRRQALRQLDESLPREIGTDLRNNLGVDLSSRYRSGGHLPDLVEACELGRQVLADSDDSGRLTAAANLAGRLSMLARHPGHEAELDDAIDIINRALQQAPETDPAGPIALTAQAGLQLHRWQRDGDVTALGGAVAAIPADRIAGATPGAVNVAGLFLEYAEQTHDPGRYDRAEALLREAIAAAGPADVAVLHGSLANALINRFDWDGDEGRLHEALNLADAAVAATSPGPALARYLTTRSMARAALARLDGDRGLLDTAIEDARAASNQPAGPVPDRMEVINSHAMLLAERYDLVGDSADLDASIALYEGFLGEPGAAMDADARPALLTNLATDLLSRFERDRRPADVQRAAALADEAIAATHPASVHLAARHDTAGRIRAAIADHFGSDPDARRAEQHAQAAVEATPAASPDHAHYLNNWAMWVTDVWDRTGDPAALQRAIGLLESALTAARDEGRLRATISFNLGARLQQKFEHDLEHDVADWAELQRACDLLDDVLAEDLPHLSLYAGKRLGDIAFRISMWPEAEHALRLSLAAAGELSGARPLRPDKQRARSGVQGIGALAALSAVRSGDTRAAAVHLEQASATLLAEALNVRGDTVRFEDIVAGCRLMRRSVLLLGATPAGGLAVLVSETGGCGHAELPGLTEEAVREATAAFRTVLADAMAGLTDAACDPLEACYTAGARLAGWTWSEVLEPLGELLAPAGRLALLPLGSLAWLPLAAAGPPGAGPALAPREPVLLIRVTAGQAGPFGGGGPQQPGRADRLRAAVWADTGPADRAIPGVLDEARRVAAVYERPMLRLNDRQQASTVAPLRASGAAPVLAPAASPAVTALMAQMLSADVAHLACHCDVNLDRPEDSVIHVDPPLRVGDIGPGVLGARNHVVLSACDAALTASSLPDEALSPATAFLLAGAGTVTAPVWPVDDRATGEFMAAYHAALALGLEPAAALSQVQAAWARTRPAFVYAPWVVVARPAPQPASRPDP